jgi:hypothetical protein
MLLSTYTHVLEELREVDGLDAREAILAARKAVAQADVASKLPEAPKTGRHLRLVQPETAFEQAPFDEADARTRTADPFITSEVLYQLSYVGAAAVKQRA